MRSAPRWFVAADVPDTVIASIAPLIEPLRARHDVRWTRPEGWHVTLAFVGTLDSDVHGGAADRLQRAVRDGVDDARASDARLERGIGLAIGAGASFGDRVLVLEVNDEPSGALDVLATSVRRSLTASGLPADDAPLRAHLTLARRPRGVRASAIGAACRDVDTAVADLAASWSLRHVGVWRSLPGAGPARYDEVSRVALDGSD